MKKNKRTGFLLSELAIVLIFIGILLAGVVVFRSGLLLKARGNKIVSFSKSSPVKDIKDVAVWYDAAVKDGFRASEFIDGAQISEWKNLSPSNNGKFNVFQSVSGNKPLYKFDSKDNLPFLEFDGDDDMDTATQVRGYEFAKADQITLIFVVKYSLPLHNMEVFNWKPETSDEIVTHFKSSGNFEWHFGHSGGSFSSEVETASSVFYDKWSIFSLVRRSGDTGEIRIDGQSVATNTMTRQLGIAKDDDIHIGHNLVGGLREIIIVKRSLSDRELEDVEDYLSRKWDIDLVN
jgi:hypothetical protein